MTGDLYLVVRNGIYAVHGTIGGQRIRVSAKTSDHRQAQVFLEDLRHEHLSGWRDGYDDASVSWKSVAGIVCARQRGAAKKRGMIFDLTPSFVFAMMERADFRCSVSGIPFSKKATSLGEVDPWAASIDRIENRHGYLKDNVRIVCVAANIAMNRWGYDTLLRLAHGITRSALAVSPELTQNLNSDLAQSAQIIDLKEVS